MRAIRWPLFLVLLAALATASAGLPEIPDTLRPAEDVLVSGQPDEAMLQQAADAGVRVVLNLRPESEDAEVDFDEAALAGELGMSYLRLPIRAPEDFTLENVQTFNGFLELIGDQPALMHCSSGNRVGAMIALRAGLLEGADTEAAIEQGKAWGLTRSEEAVRAQLEAAAERH
jgi:uncharacterized protein (TIGR01244 family)